MQHRSDRNPGEVGRLGDGDPAVVFPDRDHHPDDRAPDDENVERGKKQAAQAELDGREGDIGCEIDRKGYGRLPRHFPANRLNEYESKRDQDNGVENLPDQADGRRAR